MIDKARAFSGDLVLILHGKFHFRTTFWCIYNVFQNWTWISHFSFICLISRRFDLADISAKPKLGGRHFRGLGWRVSNLKLGPGKFEFSQSALYASNLSLDLWEPFYCNRDFYLLNYLKSHRATLPDEYRLPSESYYPYLFNQ